ncbi:cobalt transporter subunit CbtB [Motilibacter peucedani]|uniref:Cobalt transporter subunit CbtB n=1 Tax=Motilibacter peucedani TaxID=598650 RepID=A0A420XNM7_9ACTN|nr:CbtB-domain containing protein [Motilibacter peucedani]RKS73772.1 cobalt transporter subunit CbtB [Motilibacter peucedani]
MAHAFPPAQLPATAAAARADGAGAPVALPTVSLRELAPFLLLALVLGALAVYFVGAEQGATSLLGGHVVHEFVHDGRHLIGFPCH